MTSPRRAYAVITLYPESDEPYSLGICVEDEQGYHPTNYPGVRTYEEACDWARALNERMGITREEEAKIVASTMRSVA